MIGHGKLGILEPCGPRLGHSGDFRGFSGMNAHILRSGSWPVTETLRGTVGAPE